MNIESLARELEDERLTELESSVTGLKELVTRLRVEIAYLSDRVQEQGK